MRAVPQTLVAALLLALTGCFGTQGAAGVKKQRPDHPQPGPYDLNLVFTSKCPTNVVVPPNLQCIEEGAQREDCLDAMTDHDVRMLVVQVDPKGPFEGLQYALDFDPFQDVKPKFRTVRAGEVVTLHLDKKLLNDPKVPQKGFAFSVVSPDRTCGVVDPQIVIRR